MSEHIAPYMRWHAEGRTRDGVLRHQADGEAWRSFDIVHPDFMADNRNVRLGLTSDGFNHFGKHEHIPQQMARHACTVQFASLDVHETEVVHTITSYP
jgi:hypothetical protein